MSYTPQKTATVTIYGEKPEEEKPEEKPTIDWRILLLLLLLIIIVGRKR